jgi:hypothetical protein
MVHLPRKTTGTEIAAQWDGRDSLGRLRMVLDNRDLFWSLGLITKSELEMVIDMPESAVEYIINREDQPFFTSIDLKKDLDVQSHREKLLAALRAVFLN